jgi:hypothetical protein
MKKVGNEPLTRPSYLGGLGEFSNRKTKEDVQYRPGGLHFALTTARTDKMAVACSESLDLENNNN